MKRMCSVSPEKSSLDQTDGEHVIPVDEGLDGKNASLIVPPVAPRKTYTQTDTDDAAVATPNVSTGKSPKKNSVVSREEVLVLSVKSCPKTPDVELSQSSSGTPNGQTPSPSLTGQLTGYVNDVIQAVQDPISFLESHLNETDHFLENAKILDKAPESLDDIIREINMAPGEPEVHRSRNRFVEILCTDDIKSLAFVYEGISDTAKKYFHLCKLDAYGEKLKLTRRFTEFSSTMIKRSYFKTVTMLAALFGARNIIEFLLENCLLQALRDVRENGDQNIIHAMVLGSYFKLQQECVYIEAYGILMKHFQSTDDRFALLHAENDARLRPLELATKLGQYNLTKEILETEKVYKVKSVGFGPYLQDSYNVSEYYTIGARRHLSPLRDLVKIREDRLPALRESGLLDEPFIGVWRRKVFIENLITITLWVLWRLAFVALAFSFSSATDALFATMDYTLLTGTTNFEFAYNVSTEDKDSFNEEAEAFKNKSNYRGSPEALLCLIKVIKENRVHSSVVFLFTRFTLLGFAFVSITFDVSDFTCSMCRRMAGAKLGRNAEGTGGYVINNTLYRCTYFIMAVAYVAFFSISITVALGLPEGLEIGMELTKFLSNFASISFVLSKVLSIWSLLYFIQIMPGIGKFVIGFQRMLMALLQFLMIFLIIFISFSLTFTGILKLDCTKGEFVSEQQGMYTTFLIILNMVNLNKYNLQTSYIISLLHVAFILIVTILLINYLIALMSNKHAEMTEFGDIIYRLGWLDVALTASGRFTKICCCRRKRRRDCDVIVVTRIRRQKQFL